MSAFTPRLRGLQHQAAAWPVCTAHVAPA